MSKPVIYEYGSEKFWRRISLSPKYMFIRFDGNIVKILRPKANLYDGYIIGEIEVAPRFCCTVRSY